MLQGKNILLLSVKFFNYENLIKSELERMGANVTIYDERPSNSFFSKVIIRLKKDIYRSVINKYYKNIIIELQQRSFDYFLLIKGEAIPPFFIHFLRENNPHIKMIYYTADSFQNNKNGVDNLPLFDLSYTFDGNDAKKYGIHFRPLFFAPDYASLSFDQNDLKYAVAFIGTAHSDRYIISERIRKWCRDSARDMYAFYYSPSKLLFYINRFVKKSFRGFSLRKISFKSLSHLEIIDVYRRSFAILDVNHPGQDGLTMRTLETLGAGRKLLTTNSNITKYPFFHAQNVMVIDRDKVEVDPSFFKSEFVAINSDLYKAMSLQGWVEEVFEITKSKYWQEVLEK